MKARGIWPGPLQVHTYQQLSLSIEIVSHQSLVMGQCSMSVLAYYPVLASYLMAGSAHPGDHPGRTSFRWIYNFRGENESKLLKSSVIKWHQVELSLTHFWSHVNFSFPFPFSSVERCSGPLYTLTQINLLTARFHQECVKALPDSIFFFFLFLTLYQEVAWFACHKDDTRFIEYTPKISSL